MKNVIEARGGQIIYDFVKNRDEPKSIQYHEISIQETEKEEIEIKSRRKLRDRSLLHLPSKYDEFAMLSMIQEEPESYNEAINSDKSEKWIKAMNEEMEAQQEYVTWILDDLPKDKKVVPNNLIFKVKISQLIC